jgi:hypothetical protein
MRTAKRPLPNFVLRKRITGSAKTLAVSASRNMMLSTTMFWLSLWGSIVTIVVVVADVVTE